MCPPVPSLDDLPPEHRAVAELVLEKGQSFQEIARTLGMPEDRVRAVAEESAGKLRGGQEGEGPEEPRQVDLLLLFSVYVIGIVGGLAYFTVIGLTHH
jgi:Sigma-70, region 4